MSNLVTFNYGIKYIRPEIYVTFPPPASSTLSEKVGDAFRRLMRAIAVALLVGLGALGFLMNPAGFAVSAAISFAFGFTFTLALLAVRR